MLLKFCYEIIEKIFMYQKRHCGIIIDEIHIKRALICNQSQLSISNRLVMAAWWRWMCPKWFLLDFGLLYYACFKLKYFWSQFHAHAKFGQKQEKSAFHKLSDAIFRFTIAFSVEKIYRFFMFLLAGYTLYYRGI